MITPNQPTGGGQGRPGGRRNRRRRMRRPGPGGQPNQQAQGQGQGHGQNQGQPRHHQPNQQRRRKRQRQQPTFTGPMDHSYRQASDNNGNRGSIGRGGQVPRFFQHPEIEPLQAMEASSQPHIFAFVDELFFQAKIQETARKLNVKVDFVKSEQDVLDRLTGENGHSKPALVIVDLNGTSSKPLTVVHKLKARFKRETSVIGFLSHVQGDLKLKAIEAGCDMVVPRSAFSQNLPQILRRHATTEGAGETIQ